MMKNILLGIKVWLDIEEENIIELEVTVVEIIYNKTRGNNNKQYGGSVSSRWNSSSLIYI